MTFKKSGNGRDDRSNNSSRRSASSGNGQSRKSYSSPSSKSSSGFKKEGEDDRPKRKPSEGGYSGEKKFKPKPSGDYKKPYGSREGSEGSSSTGGFKKPYGTRDGSERPASAGGFKKPYGTRDGSERPASAGGFKKPYGSRDGADRPASAGGFKKPHGSRDGADRPASAGGFKKPYSSRDGADRPAPTGGFKKPYDSRNDSTGEGKAPFAGRATGTDNPKSFSRDKASTSKPRSVRETFFDEEGAAPTGDKIMRGRKKPAAKPEKDADKGKIRLNRYISNAGICSRRKADELIVAGVVSVNGEVVSELGFKVDPMKDEIRYNGETLRREKMVYVLLNKPKHYITTTEDPQERRTVMHLVDKASKERIYPVGRLDRNTTGLLLMTNDGDLADKLSHPRNSVTKIYHVELDKSLSQGDLNKIAFGLELEDGPIKPDTVSYVTGGSKREVGIQIHSGKNHIVRRIFQHLGYEVVKLDRVVYANLTKKDLPRGRWRFLEEKEVIQLKHLI